MGNKQVRADLVPSPRRAVSLKDTRGCNVRGGTIVIISTDTKTRHREQRWKDVDCCESVALSSCTISPATPPLLREAPEPAASLKHLRVIRGNHEAINDTHRLREAPEPAASGRCRRRAGGSHGGAWDSAGSHSAGSRSRLAGSQPRPRHACPAGTVMMGASCCTLPAHRRRCQRQQRATNG